MIKSSLRNYSDAYLETIAFANTAEADADANNEDKKVIFKIGALFAGCLSKMSNTQVVLKTLI